VISFEDLSIPYHCYVMQTIKKDFLFSCTSFSKNITDSFDYYKEKIVKLKSIEKHHGLSLQFEHTILKEAMLTKICEILNKEEEELDKTLVDIVVNPNILQSFVIMKQN
jgi:hypothetical protein